jgi:hypothetical protein
MKPIMEFKGVIISDFSLDETGRFEVEPKQYYLIPKILEEIQKNDDLEYWGTDENIKAETEIFNAVIDLGFVSQDWFDDRLKATNVEMLEDLLIELNK